MALLGRAGRLRRKCVAALAAVISLTLPVESAVSREYQVKAAFLFNFARFADWPAAAFPELKTPFVIGVLGADPFGGVLDEVVANEAIYSRPVIVRRFREVQEISVCHILYISASEAPRLTRVLAALEGRPILTVGDTTNFAASNGVIQFVLVEKRVRLRINVTAARTAKLTISSQLLRQAELIEAK